MESHPSDFNQYAKRYDADLNSALRATGEDKSYFAKNRIQLVKTLLKKQNYHPKTIIDFGCGIGGSIPYFFDILDIDRAIGVDNSEKSLKLANEYCSYQSKYLGKFSFKLISQFKPKEEFDLAFCNGVFHHILPEERPENFDYIYTSLKKGAYFCYWENNPWNLGTKYIMSKIPFDASAKTLTPPESRKLLTQSGFTVVSSTYKFLFPKFLSFLRPLENAMVRIPLLAQYMILCKK